jgi:hypothetical protein
MGGKKITERKEMAQCITCGSELHPERAVKYNYCTARECQEKNAKGLTMVAVGVNKAAEQYLILDERTRDELASGKYHDQRRGSFGTSVPSAPVPSAPAPSAPVPSSGGGAPASAEQAAEPAGRKVQPGRNPAPRSPAPRSPAPRSPAPRSPAPRSQAPSKVARKPWSKSQEKLALLYNQQGLRPDEIAQKLRLSTYVVTQIILTSRNRGKL